MIFERQFFTLHFPQCNYICQRRSQLGKNREIILHLTKKKRNVFKKNARSCWVKQGRTSAYFLCFRISEFPIITGLHHPSKLNFFQEIRKLYFLLWRHFLPNVFDKWVFFFFCIFIKLLARINCNFSAHRQNN